MQKSKISNIFCINNQRLLFKKYISLLILFISQIKIIYSENLSGIEKPYPVCFQLNNSNLFLANEVGMFFSNLNLTSIKKYQYTGQDVSDFEKIIDKIAIVQFQGDENENNLICAVDTKFYFFTENGDFITTGYLPNDITNSAYLDLLAYKIDNEKFYHFIVVFMNSDNKIFYFYHYKVKGENCSLISNYEYTPFYFDYPNIEINNKLFTCQIMYSESRKENVLTCCFQTMKNDLIIVQSFNIEQNLSEIEEYYAKTPIDHLNQITSAISEDKKNILVCYSPDNYFGYCFNYNFDQNKITNNNPYINKCTTKYSLFKVTYFKSKKYIFICENNENAFTLIFFDNEFNKINLNDISTPNFYITDCYQFNSLSLIYDSNKDNYEIILDPKINNGNCVTQKFLITKNFIANLQTIIDKPQELTEKPNTEEETLKENNKYYIYVEDRNFIGYSNYSNLVIDFIHEENLYIKTKDNGPIDPYLYSFKITIEQEIIGILNAEINGKEIKIEKSCRLSNITKFIYYPQFGEESLMFTFSYILYLKNISMASKSAQISVYICKKNCTCDVNEFTCKNCLENYVFYKTEGNCNLKSELISAVYDENRRIYLDCYKNCKTCSAVGYSEYNMNCLTCYEEYGDYMVEGNKCYEKYCENLYYKDKETRMKICINETSCPEEYPILDKDTKQCKQNKTQEVSSTYPSSSTESTNTNKPSTSSTSSDLTSNHHIDQSSSSSSSTKNFEHISLKPLDSQNETISYEKIMDIIKNSIGEENLDKINMTYSLLSNSIKNVDISSFKEDITISGKNITYQITTSENQKNLNHDSNESIIYLGECENKIKKNISYENDPTPLLILKIDVKKHDTTAVEYEIYNPYNGEKIDLSICSDTTIAVYAPINLDNEEISLYDDLNEQGYDLYDANNSFYLDPCTQYTSSNGTDVSLHDRKDYYYKEDVVLCEDSCKYINVNTQYKKVHCECSVKNDVNMESDQGFSPQAILENFYKVDAYANFEVLFCYKLLFSSKGLKKNICFYIILVFFFFFLVSMSINLFSAMKKIDEIIFKIFQDRFMYYFVNKVFIDKEGKKRRNGKIDNDLINMIKKNNPLSELQKVNLLQRLKVLKNKNSDSKVIDSTCVLNKNNLYNINQEINHIKVRKKNKRKGKKKVNVSLINTSSPKDINNVDNMELHNKRYIKTYHSAIDIHESIRKKVEKEDNSNIDKQNIINNQSQDINANDKNIIFDSPNIKRVESKKKISNININIINNIMNKQNPPKNHNNASNDLEDTNIVNNEEKHKNIEKLSQKIKRRKSKKSKKKSIISEVSASSISNSNSTSVINLKKNLYFGKIGKKNKLSFSNNELKDEYFKKELGKPKMSAKSILEKSYKENKSRNNIIYIDEELNQMDYQEAIISDKRTYCQYYWSLLKKKHMIVLTFVSINDYNVFLLKFSLFIISITLFFSINTLFYKDSTMHQIYTDKGKYNLLYQIPQILYSTMISFFMTLILKKLSLSQNELIEIKKELDHIKSQQLADKSKKCLRIKLFSFFSFGLILLLFFWYYISAFAAVYTNTQIHLIKDTLVSFGISMLYPFIINIFPGIFRFPALKSEKKDKETLYKIGQIIALL